MLRRRPGADKCSAVNSAPQTNRGNDSSCISASVTEHELITTRIYNAARVSWRSHCKLMSATAAVSSTNIDIVVNIEARMRTVQFSRKHNELDAALFSDS